jgi:hypothetical protein
LWRIVREPRRRLGVLPPSSCRAWGRAWTISGRQSAEYV